MDTNPAQGTSQDPVIETNQQQDPAQQDNQITINADDYKADQRRISNLEKKLEGKQGSNIEPSKSSNDDNTVSKEDYDKLKESLDKVTAKQSLNEAKSSLIKTANADKVSLSDEDIDFIVVQGDDERTKKNYEYVKSFKSQQQPNVDSNKPEPNKTAPKASKREGDVDFGAQLAEQNKDNDLSKWL